MTLRNYKAHLLYYIKLCASFQTHRWIQTRITVPKRSIQVKMGDFLSRVTLKLDGWPWKTPGHQGTFFYTTSSFLQYFKTLVYSNWSYSPETLNSGQNWRFFLSRVTLAIDGWPWKTIGTSSVLRQALGIILNPLVKSNLSYSWKCPIWVKIDDFLAVWPWNSTDGLAKQ